MLRNSRKLDTAPFRRDAGAGGWAPTESRFIRAPVERHIRRVGLLRSVGARCVKSSGGGRAENIEGNPLHQLRITCGGAAPAVHVVTDESAPQRPIRLGLKRMSRRIAPAVSPNARDRLRVNLSWDPEPRKWRSRASWAPTARSRADTPRPYARAFATPQSSRCVRGQFTRRPTPRRVCKVGLGVTRPLTYLANLGRVCRRGLPGVLEVSIGHAAVPKSWSSG